MLVLRWQYNDKTRARIPVQRPFFFATRFILHGEFYPTLDQVIIEDCFRKAIQKYGIPEAVFFDNGSQYRTKWMNRACAKMGIRLLFARPYSPGATGKVERFNRVVDSFRSEEHTS